jgi:hypothetical protein
VSIAKWLFVLTDLNQSINDKDSGYYVVGWWISSDSSFSFLLANLWCHKGSVLIFFMKHALLNIHYVINHWRLLKKPFMQKKDKRTNNDLKTQKVKHRTTPTSLKTVENSCAPEGLLVSAPLVTPIVLLLIDSAPYTMEIVLDPSIRK